MLCRISFPAFVLAVVAGLIPWNARRQGKAIEFPACGRKHASVSPSEKVNGFGISLLGIGDFSCPKCNYRCVSSSFRTVKNSQGKKAMGTQHERGRGQDQ